MTQTQKKHNKAMCAITPRAQALHVLQMKGELQNSGKYLQTKYTSKREIKVTLGHGLEEARATSLHVSVYFHF